ncbi:MAG: hypothetical protein FJY76_04375 [Candidatus Aenigmarchaeota archaeon]|nr:hypothetical protein [Candidatus Aenigmarchaeota archaeon]
MRDASIQRKDEILETDVYRYFGITPEQLNQANSNLDPSLLREAKIRFERIMDNNSCGFIVSGYDTVARCFKIYWAPTFIEPRDMTELKYDTAGSGSDLADASIADSLQRMKPDERDNIGLARGCRMLMGAVRASWHNAGVGGRTQVIWTGKDKPKTELGYKESDTLQNLLFLETKGVVGRDFVDGVFRDVMEQEARYADVRKRLIRAIPKEVLTDTFFVEGLHT